MEEKEVERSSVEGKAVMDASRRVPRFRQRWRCQAGCHALPSILTPVHGANGSNSHGWADCLMTDSSTGGLAGTVPGPGSAPPWVKTKPGSAGLDWFMALVSTPHPPSGCCLSSLDSHWAPLSKCTASCANWAGSVVINGKQQSVSYHELICHQWHNWNGQINFGRPRRNQQ